LLRLGVDIRWRAASDAADPEVASPGALAAQAETSEALRIIDVRAAWGRRPAFNVGEELVSHFPEPYGPRL
jgi:hypothetical protein